MKQWLPHALVSSSSVIIWLHQQRVDTSLKYLTEWCMSLSSRPRSSTRWEACYLTSEMRSSISNRPLVSIKRSASKILTSIEVRSSTKTCKIKQRIKLLVLSKLKHNLKRVSRLQRAIISQFHLTQWTKSIMTRRKRRLKVSQKAQRKAKKTRKSLSLNDSLVIRIKPSSCSRRKQLKDIVEKRHWMSHLQFVVHPQMQTVPWKTQT